MLKQKLVNLIGSLNGGILEIAVVDPDNHEVLADSTLENRVGTKADLTPISDAGAPRRWYEKLHVLLVQRPALLPAASRRLAPACPTVALLCAGGHRPGADPARD